jgi:hypothetical protein
MPAATKTRRGRLMKGEELEYTPDERLILFYRENPIVAIEELFDIQLMWHQRIMIRALWNKRFVMLCISRGVGKSFIFMIFAMLKAILYPDTQIGFITPTYRQVRRYIFPEIDKISKRCPYFKKCIDGRISMSTDGCIIRFKNGSFIEGLPPGHDGRNIRGRRYHVVLGDEFAQIDSTLIKEVVRPMLNIQIHGRYNQYHVASTPYYKWNHFWPSYLHHLHMCKIKPDEFELVEFDYRDVNETPTSKKMPALPYIVDENIIAMQKADMTDEQFSMENLSRFPDEMSSYFSSRLLDYASPRKQPGPVEILFAGKKDESFVLGIDVARRVDNFALAVIKDENGRRKLVQMVTLKSATYPEMHAAIREILVKFPVLGIAIGSGGGGDAIKDLLAVPWKDPKTGIVHQRMLSVLGDDERHDLLPGTRIVHMIDETNRLNNVMYSAIKSDMEHHRFLFPSPRIYGADTLAPKEEEAIKEIIATQNEFMKLQAIPTTMGHRFEPPNPEKDRKDRATACVLGNFLLSEKAKDILPVSVDLGTGFWAQGPQRGF